MSKQSIRAQVSKKLLENVNRQSEKIVSEAARIVLQSAQASQCLILDRKAVRALQNGFEAGIGRPLIKSEGTKYRREVKKFFVQNSSPLPDYPGKAYFLQILKRNGLVMGRNIFYTGVSFDTIKDRYHRFNLDFIQNTKSLKDSNTKYDKSNPGRITQFDHGAEGTSVATLGGATQAFQLGIEQGFTEKELLDKAGSNLAAIVEDRFKDLNKSQRSKLKARLYEVIVNWNQVVTRAGDLNAGVGIIIRPIASEENLGRSPLEAKEFNALLDAVDSAITGIPWADIEGSSTLRQKAEKVIVTSLTDKLASRRIKKKIDPVLVRAKLKTKNNVKDSTKSSKSFKPRGRKGIPGARLASAPAQRKQNRSNNSFVSLMAYLNTKLPGVVQKNMGSPRLENRSGRFAQSVRVTDIALTAKGHPSIGYTYMRYPYETFEVGNLQGDRDRDPRRLIDASIREIAAEAAVGRLFTRRT